MAELFKPMTQAFYEIWLDGKPAEKTEYWQRDIGKEHLGVDLAEVRKEDRGNGIITGHAVEPLYGRTVHSAFILGLSLSSCARHANAPCLRMCMYA